MHSLDTPSWLSWHGGFHTCARFPNRIDTGEGGDHCDGEPLELAIAPYTAPLMVTSSVLGSFRASEATRAEFMALIRQSQ